MRKIVLATLIIFVTQILVTNTCLAFGARTSFISGSVWYDTNDNAAQDLDEELVANIKVFAQNQETQEIVETLTNHAGTFVIANLPYGRYSVWCEDRSGVKTPPYSVELDEVSGTAEAVNFALQSTKVTPEEESDSPTPGFSKPIDFVVFLPIINS